MFYEPSKGHGLPHDPSKAIVAPRPIGWISTVNKAGKLNLAPYSFFNAFSTRPFIVWFSSEGEKDSATFAEETGEFVANLVSRDLAEKMVRTAVDAPRGVSEFDYADLAMAPSRLVAPPRVAAAPAALECRVTEILRPKALDGTTSAVVVAGEVVGVHIDDAFLNDGMFDIVRAGNVGRLGYMDYASVSEIFSMRRPRWGKD
ncbi:MULTISPECIES: flavin reductase family protein [unclassified Mesorhizobium]|uniref:flavin reductase family protein n=1 Tax=unclassified Mesorhizobium TaxID=325217 RepID=UPI000F758861|nr:MULTISPECIES: flavin reductase family protein [unclassified Mesorhizobium]RUU33958.1 flavin reductase family protein [Mesorhizobium sp. M6A.T.Ca.TU.002.02.2.1]AZO68118.1 flavin reductase family protein [Mesorhizobium sp. M6A.T.Cr.TU.016.01.1.1]RUU43494.1 flavin reductase family protein [Mesorhizobium sp. M6A.T.Ce.TU.002.03.1.1]RWP52716.1 MAG: flavin reductase family protein [Mesorhizobium sp.]RWP73986.1 MAG: flavin reductase family protein [Mesorhizobium sp.]